MNVTVSKDGQYEFHTIQAALDSIKNRQITDQEIFIHMKPGIYEEKIVIDIPNITILGEDDQVENTVITYGDYAKMIMPDGSVYGTTRTATFRIDADGFTAKNITFMNSAGNGKEYGQAVAVCAQGDKISFYNCRMLACQDTLFTMPLPLERINERQYFYRCYIRGDVDFIFGGATVFFEECEIFSQNGMIEDEAKLAETGEDDMVQGYVTAARTTEGQEYGYVFYKCNFTSDCPKNSIYIGRPWRNFAKTVLIKCKLGEHIKPAMWHDWDKLDAHDTTYYGEYENICTDNNSDISQRVSWSHQISDRDSKKYRRDVVLDGWVL